MTSVTAFVLVQRDRPRGLLALIAGWAIVTGVLQLGWTFSIHIQHGRVVLALAAVLSVAFGASLPGVRPPDLLSAVWRLAVYALLLGALRLVVNPLVPGTTFGGFKLLGRPEKAVAG